MESAMSAMFWGADKELDKGRESVFVKVNKFETKIFTLLVLCAIDERF